MTISLHPQVVAAQDAVRSLERALTSSRSHWDDATRRSFDQRHGDVLVTSGRSVADELASLARELDAALALLS